MGEVFALVKDKLWKTSVDSYNPPNPDSFRQIIDGPDVIYGLFRLRTGVGMIYDLITGEKIVDHLDYGGKLTEIAFENDKLYGYIDTGYPKYRAGEDHAEELVGVHTEFQVRELPSRIRTAEERVQQDQDVGRVVLSAYNLFENSDEIHDTETGKTLPFRPYPFIQVEGDLFYDSKGKLIKRSPNGSEEEIGTIHRTVCNFAFCDGFLFDSSVESPYVDYGNKTPFDKPWYHRVHKTVQNEEIFRIGGEPVYFHPYIGLGAKTFLVNYGGRLLVLGTFSGLHLINPKNSTDTILFPEIKGVTSVGIVSSSNLERLVERMEKV